MRTLVVLAVALMVAACSPDDVDEPAGREAGDEAASEQDEPPEPDPPATFDEAVEQHFGSRLVEVDRYQGQLGVVFRMDEPLTVGQLVRDIEDDTATVYAAAFDEPGADAETVEVWAEVELTNDFGDGRWEVVYSTSMDADIASQVNWDAPNEVNWSEVWTVEFEHEVIRG